MKTRKYAVLFVSLLAAQACAAEVTDDELLGETTQALSQPKMLALGDSVAFGFDPFAEDFNKKKTFIGYPEILNEDFKVKNASCPGETSASFFSSTALDNGCRAFREHFKLHVGYDDSETQLDYALNRIANPENAPDIITLNISGNDIFLLEENCNFDALCFQQGLPATIGALVNNVATIFGSLRGAGFDGELVFLNLYSSTNQPSSLALVGAINSSIASIFPLFDVQLADGLGAFLEAAGGQSPCEAGLLIPLPSGEGCNVHPSQAGAEALAQAILDVL